MIARKQLEVRVAGVDVQIDVQGSGPAIAFVQGGASTTDDYWLSLPEDLARDHTAATFDRPGTGKSPIDVSPHLPEQAEQLAAILEAVGGSPTWLVAHSFGGPVSLQLASDRPDLVAGLVLLDPTPANAPEMVKGASLIFGPIAWAETSRLPGAGLVLSAVRSLLLRARAKERKKMAIAEADGFDGYVETVFSHQQASQLLRLMKHFPADGSALIDQLRAQDRAIPGVLVTAGRKDGHKGTRVHRELAEIAGLEFRQWDDCTHVVHLDQPDRTRELIEQMVDQAP